MEEGGPPVIYELTAESAAGQRIDKYLSEQLADLSRSYLQKLLKDGGVEVNGKTVKRARRGKRNTSKVINKIIKTRY